MLLRRSSTRTSDPRMPPRTTAPSTTMSVQSAPTASANARSPIAPMFNAPTTSVMSPRPLVVVSRVRSRKSIAYQHSDGRSNEDRNDVDQSFQGRSWQTLTVRIDTDWSHKARSRAVDRGDLPLRADLLVRLTFFAPRCRDSSIAATLSASPTPSPGLIHRQRHLQSTPSDRLGFDRRQASNSPPQTRIIVAVELSDE